MPKDQEKLDRLKKFDAIRTEILKDYRDNISSRNPGVPVNTNYVRLIASIKYVYKLFEMFLNGEEDISVFFSLYHYKGLKIKKFLMLTFFSEEERAHFSDLRMEWLQTPHSRYQLWWKIFNHLCVQKFLVAPIVAPILSFWELCARTVMYIFWFL